MYASSISAINQDRAAKAILLRELPSNEAILVSKLIERAEARGLRISERVPAFDLKRWLADSTYVGLFRALVGTGTLELIECQSFRETDRHDWLNSEVRANLRTKRWLESVENSIGGLLRFLLDGEHEHAKAADGPRVPANWGSWPTEVCACGHYRVLIGGQPPACAWLGWKPGPIPVRDDDDD